MKISLLEFGEGDVMENSLIRLRNVFDYAIKADQLEYNRFWLAEHHLYNRKLAWGCPMPLIPVIAGITKQIRVGTGGVLLNIHNSFDVVAQFKLWNNIYSNRIDLGVAGARAKRVEAINSEEIGALSFDSKFEKLASYINDEERLIENKVILPPYQGITPELWALSASALGFYRSLKYGTNYVRSIFHEFAELDPEKEAFDAFKAEFYKMHGREVKTMLSISGACLKNENRLGELRDIGKKDEKYHLIGNLNFIEDKLSELLQTYGADEILWRDMNRNMKEKFETLDLLSSLIHDETLSNLSLD